MIALPSSLSSLTSWASPDNLLAFFAGAICSAIVALIINFIPRRHWRTPELTNLPPAEQKEKVEQIVKGPVPTPAPKPVAAPLEKPVKAMLPASTRTGRRTPMPPVGLRTEALVKLPKTAKRRRARVTVTLLGTLIVVGIIAGGGYFIWQKTDWFRGSSATELPTFVEQTPASTPATPTPPPTGGPTPTPTATTEPKDTVTVQETETGYLNVREGDSLGTPVLTQIKPGESYELLAESENGEWYKIQVDEDTAGWVAARYATKD